MGRIGKGGRGVGQIIKEMKRCQRGRGGFLEAEERVERREWAVLKNIAGKSLRLRLRNILVGQLATLLERNFSRVVECKASSRGLRSIR